MKSLEEILKEGFKSNFINRHKYVSQEFQDYGYRLAMKLGELPRVSMFIKLAKNKPRALLDQAYSFAIDYPHAQNRSKLFLWKLKELENEREERLRAKNKNLKIILLDIDGVLVNEKERFSSRYCREHNVEMDILLKFFNGDFEKCLTGKKDLKKALKKCLKEWKWKGSVDDLIKYWVEEDIKYNPFNELMISELMKLDRQKYKLYIATNQEQYRAQYFKEKLKDLLDIDGFFASSNIGIEKKSSKFFEKILKLLYVDPNQVYYIDDQAKNLRAAKRKGIHTYLYPDITIEELIHDAGIHTES